MKMMPWMGSREASITTEIARLETEIARLNQLYVDSPPAPEQDDEARMGRLAIRQSIVAAEQQIDFLRH